MLSNKLKKKMYNILDLGTFMNNKIIALVILSYLGSMIAQEEISFRATAHGHLINIIRSNGTYLSFTKNGSSIKQWVNGREQNLDEQLYHTYLGRCAFKKI